MFKIYKRTIHIGTSENPQGRLEYRLEKKSGSSLSRILAIPAMIAGAVVGTLVFSYAISPTISSASCGYDLIHATER